MSCFSTMGSSWAERWAAGTHRGGQRVTFTVSLWQHNTLSQHRAKTLNQGKTVESV